MDKPLSPSTSPKLSMDDAFRALPAGFCQFELTVVGTTGLCGMTAWSQGQRCYVTVSVGSEPLHKTTIAENVGELEWNDTFQFVAKRSDDLTFSVYVTGTLSCQTLLGRFEESLMDVDRTGEDISRNVCSAQIEKSFTLNFRFEPRSRMFGLIIGIDKYESDEIRDLKGCKGDAQSVVDFLSHKFHIRSSHFLRLADERATRSAIIDGFQNHLINNSNIEHGDAMVIFYAGHGSRAFAPQGWIADNKKVETVCPHDERTIGRDGKEIFGIPDRTIGGLLRKLSFLKGDNITMILDSCHSGGSTRSLKVARRAENASPLPEELDKDIWMWGLPPIVAPNLPTGFLDKTMSSHILLAACRHDEKAYEDPMAEVIRGAFTHCLVGLLYQEDLTRITYSELFDLLPRLELQHPQCHGKNRGRTLFNGASGARPTTFGLSAHGDAYRTNVGSIHGVIKGTVFAIHTQGTIASDETELGILEADYVDAFTCILRRRSGDKYFTIPSGARALVLNWRQDQSLLKVFLEPSRDEVQSAEHNFSLVDSPDSADLIVRQIDCATFQFERLDPFIQKWAPMLNEVKLSSDLSRVLQGISHFHYHLYRRNSASPLMQKVEVVLRRLRRIEDTDETMYMPDGEFDMPLLLNRENTVFISNAITASYDSNRVFYGLTVTNKSGRNLFPYLVYFDPSDYSIQSWYHPPAATMAAPLAAHSTLPVGYGEANIDALEFSLADGVTSDVGFLRLFVSTTYVDLTVLEQSSPFLSARGAKKEKPPRVDVWDVWTFVLRTVETGTDIPH